MRPDSSAAPLEDGLEMFEVKCPILYFLLLVLIVSFNPTSDGVLESPGVSKILSKENLGLRRCNGHPLRRSSIATVIHHLI